MNLSRRSSPSQRRPQRQSPEAGLTLVELMVSLVILSIVMAGAINMGFSMMNGYRYMRIASAVERGGRTSLTIVADAIKLASPAVKNGDIVDLSDATDCEPYPPNTSPDIGLGSLVFRDGGANDSDELTVVYAAGVVTSMQNATSVTDFSTYIAVNDAGGFTDDDFALVVANDLSQGLLFRIDTVDYANDRLELGAAVSTMCSGRFAAQVTASNYVADVSADGLPLVLRVRKARFFVDTAAGGDLPLLWMDPDGAGPDDPEPISEGIEDLQVEVHIDGPDKDNVDGIGNDDIRFDSTGESISAGEIVRGVRISLVSRSVKPVGNDASSTRPALGNRSGGTADGYLRRTYQSTVEIRNLAGSPGTDQ